MTKNETSLGHVTGTSCPPHADDNCTRTLFLVSSTRNVLVVNIMGWIKKSKHKSIVGAICSPARGAETLQLKRGVFSSHAESWRRSIEYLYSIDDVDEGEGSWVDFRIYSAYSRKEHKHRKNQRNPATHGTNIHKYQQIMLLNFILYVSLQLFIITLYMYKLWNYPLEILIETHGPNIVKIRCKQLSVNITHITHSSKTKSLPSSHTDSTEELSHVNLTK